MTIRLTITALALAASMGPAAAREQARVTLQVPATLLKGAQPHATIDGLAPGQQVELETFRSEPVSIETNGQWSTLHPVYHAHATFGADRRGRVSVDTAMPMPGSTYTSADPRGLLWSGRVAGRAGEPAAEIADLKPGMVRWSVRIDGKQVATAETALTKTLGGLRIERVDMPGLVGVYAAPAGARHASTLIYLHGSEGGTFKDAQAQAELYASRGFASFALIYFTWPYERIANAPAGFINLPVERLDIARQWLAQQAEADPKTIAVVGASKGAEFGLLGASVYPWIDKLVACVPSSLVWGGFGGDDAHELPSFTQGGKAVPALAYGDYGPVLRHEILSVERHRRDRLAASNDTVAAATIPVERAKARILLLSGGHDAMWPSSPMAGEVVARLRSMGLANRVQWRDFPDAGHFICGTGDAPTRYFDGDPVMNGGGTADGNGAAAGHAWDATLAFLRN